MQAGSQSWKAFFFGSSDAANSITVDKTPAFLWPMELSVRLFGLNAWSILVPQALEGVAAVGVLHLAVKRTAGPAAGLIAGAVLATTPVAALMFRYNNPDAMLVLLLTMGAYALVRALERARTAWVLAAFGLVGFAFLAKMLQAFLVLPAFAVVYLLAAPTTLRRRLGQLVAGGVAAFAACAWWVAAVELWPGATPYIGGSQDGTVLDLVFGYNGFGRLTGNETGSVGGGGRGGTGQWGPTGWLRLFNTQFGGQASWLLPTALLLGAATLAWTLRSDRTDRTRAGALLWGGWLVITGLTFSLGKGIIHPYYTVALAPGLGGVIGIGAVTAWRHRASIVGRAVVAAAVLVSVWWSHELMRRSPDWHPALASALLPAGLVVAALLLAGPRLPRRALAAAALAGVVVAGAAPATAAVATASVPHTGAIPSASPTASGGFGRLPGFGGPARGVPGGGTRTPPAGGPAGRGGFGGARTGGGLGGLLDAGTPSAEVQALLEQDAGAYDWAAAAIGSNNAAGFQLATGLPVMPIGGFNGTDPSPTLEQFQRWVAEGRIHWFIAGGGFGFGGARGGTGTASSITAWVEATFTATTVGGTTLYDLSGS